MTLKELTEQINSLRNDATINEKVVDVLDGLKDYTSNIITNITDGEAKVISNAINNVKDFRIVKSGFQLDGDSIPMLVNGKDGFNVVDTESLQTIEFIDEPFPITFTSAKEIDFKLPNGKYMAVNYSVDGNYIAKLYKVLPEGEFLGTVNNSYTIDARVQDFGSDMLDGTPMYFSVKNKTSFSKNFLLKSEFQSKTLESADLSSTVITPYSNYNYMAVISYNIDMKDEKENIILKLYHTDTDTVIGETTLIAGQNYPFINLGQINAPDFEKNSFEIIIENE